MSFPFSSTSRDKYFVKLLSFAKNISQTTDSIETQLNRQSGPLIN